MLCTILRFRSVPWTNFAIFNPGSYSSSTGAACYSCTPITEIGRSYPAAIVFLFQDALHSCNAAEEGGEEIRTARQELRFVLAVVIIIAQGRMDDMSGRVWLVFTKLQCL